LEEGVRCIELVEGAWQAAGICGLRVCRERKSRNANNPNSKALMPRT
jgi:hypothetical protein